MQLMNPTTWTLPVMSAAASFKVIRKRPTRGVFNAFARWLWCSLNFTRAPQRAVFGS
ncbi:Uncharacterised protein [Mobiluncus mulieris]|nr:Uncharacterised protein [Mobiluncus mulieris]